MRKRIIALLVVLSVVISLFAGCSTGDSNSETVNVRKKTSTGASKELLVSYFLGGIGDEWFKYLKTEFERTHQGVTVVLDGSPSMNDTMVSRIEGNIDVPDIMFLYTPGLWLRWGTQGKILELSDMYAKKVPGTEITLENYIVDSRREMYFFNNGTTTKKYAMPWSDGVTGIVYNKNMFDSNGWSFPDTWDGFVELCNKIKAKGIAPLTYPGLSAGYTSAAIMPWIAQELGDNKYKQLMNPTSDTIYEDTGILKAWEKYEQLFKSGWILKGTQALTHIQAQMEFLNGKAAMIFDGFWLESEMKTAMPKGFEMRMAPIPAGGVMKTRAINRGTSDWVGIPTKAKNIDLAKEFYMMSTSNDSCIRFAELSGSFRPFKNDISIARVSNFTKSISEIMKDDTIYNCSMESSSPLYVDINAGSNAYADISTGNLTAMQFYQKYTPAAKSEYAKKKNELGIK